MKIVITEIKDELPNVVFDRNENPKLYKLVERLYVLKSLPSKGERILLGIGERYEIFQIDYAIPQNEITITLSLKRLPGDM